VDVKTDELIVALARAAGPVRPLARPSHRLARWAAATVPLTALAAILIGLRHDVSIAIAQPAFVGVAVATFATALISAASVLVLSVPGAERSIWQRLLPLVAGSAWVLALVVLLMAEGQAVPRLLSWPLHWLCVIEIAALSVLPAWALFAMVRRAAPLRPAWCGAMAMLAAVSIGAAATQFVCPLDDPAHQLVGHALPVAMLSMLGALAGQRYLNWLTQDLRA
jgi:hypothetical protein